MGTEERHRVVILYATQTGNAEDVADRIRREAARRHYSPVLFNIEKYSMSKLASESTVIFVVSTTGAGSFPDSMKESWTLLMRGPPKDEWLSHVHFAVFGLGDSGYQHYNVAAKKLHNRLIQRGGKPLLLRGLGDDQHRLGYDAALTPWLDSLWKIMRERFRLPSDSTDPSNEAAWELESPKYRITYHDRCAAKTNKVTDVEARWLEHENARRMMETANEGVSEEASGSKKKVAFARAVTNARLTDPKYEQDVRHLEFDISNSGLTYAPGDALGIFPSQPEQAVDKFMKICHLDPDAYVTVEAATSAQHSGFSPVALRTLVEAVMDIASASPGRYFFEVMSHFAQDEREKECLQHLASAEGQQKLYEYNKRESRTVLEVLEEFFSVELPLEWLLQLVPRLRPRYYSISSSMKAHPNQVHAAVAVLEWTTPYGRRRKGLCSSWLAGLRAGQDRVPLWISEGVLKSPPANVPLVLVGPGTGCAPFRALMEERAMLSKRQAVAPVMFFFGCRTEEGFLYRDFWFSLTTDNGILSPELGGGLFVAFSRGQATKVYVQHRIQEQADKVVNLLREGGLVYICGSAAKNMPVDVVSALESCVPEPSNKRILKKSIVIEAW